MKHTQPKGILNGHTWIIILISILSLFAIGVAEILAGFFIIKNLKFTTEIEVLGNDILVGIIDTTMATVPLQVIFGIIKIIKSLFKSNERIIEKE